MKQAMKQAVKTSLLEIWDKMAEIMQITFQYGNQIRL